MRLQDYESIGRWDDETMSLWGYEMFLFDNELRYQTMMGDDDEDAYDW